MLMPLLLAPQRASYTYAMPALLPGLLPRRSSWCESGRVNERLPGTAVRVLKGELTLKYGRSPLFNLPL